MKKLLEQIQKLGVLPVIKIQNADHAEGLGAALMAGGLPAAEVTFRTEAAEEAIARMHKAYPDMLIGAGTILTCEQADRAMAAGASFIVSPGLNPKVVGHSVAGIPVYHINELEAKMKKHNVQIGVLTVPIDCAQEVADKMIVWGIRAIWNFTPLRIRVPDDIVVQNTSLYAHLSLMFNRLEGLESEPETNQRK